MQDASPNNSSLAFYTYDGEKFYSMSIYDVSIEQTILDKLDAVKTKEVKNWSLEDITLPIYGFEIDSTNGTSLYAVWSNGYWISKEGKVYSFDFDFAGLEQDYSWSSKNEFSSLLLFPCARILAQDENGWNNTFLTPAVKLNPPDGIEMTLNSWEVDTVTVNIINNSGSEWFYGEYYRLQVLLDDEWYEIPTASGNFGFNDIGFIIKDGEERSMTYHLTMYGDLPNGTYRLVAKDLFVEN